MFLNIMRHDNRINSAYTKDGSILYTKKDDNRVYKIVNLYEGAFNLFDPTKNISGTENLSISVLNNAVLKPTTTI